MVKERYYAVRIGNPKQHRPYLLLCDQGSTPALFSERSGAEAARSGFGERTVVRVEIRELRKGSK